MKTSNVILSFLLNTCIFANTPAPLSYDQAARLMESAWKEPPLSIDITFNVTLKDNSKSREELQQIYKETYDKMHETTEEVSPSVLARRDKFVRSNVDHFLEERKLKRRIRFDGNRMRMDETFSVQEIAVLNRAARRGTVPGEGSAVNVEFERSVIEVTDQNNTSERYEFNHRDKQASKMVKPNREPWDNEILQFGLSPVAQLLRAKLGISRGGSRVNFSPDPNKFELLRANSVDGLRVKIRPDENEPDMKDRIDLIFSLYRGDEEKPILDVTLVCDKQDYSQVYHCERRMPGSNELLSTRICSDFDAQGYPHNVTVTEYGADGKLKRKKVYQIENVDLNISIPNEAFWFDPPEGYMVYDYRLSPAEHEAAQIAHLQELLTHEDPSERVQTLFKLSHLLKKSGRTEELRGIATVMKDDPDRRVQQVAETILRSIEMDRSDTE